MSISSFYRVQFSHFQEYLPVIPSDNILAQDSNEDNQRKHQ